MGGGCWWVVGGGRCSIWQHTYLPRGSCQILLLEHPLSSETQKFGTAIFDTFNNGTHAEAVNRFLASHNSCRTGHATQRMSVYALFIFFKWNSTQHGPNVLLPSAPFALPLSSCLNAHLAPQEPELFLKPRLGTVVCSPFF